MISGGPAPVLPPTFWGLIEQGAQQWGDLTILADDQGGRISFTEYRDRCEAVAAGLHERGVQAGTVVSWMLPTTIDTVVVMGALARLGAAQNPIITMLREREVRYITNEARTEFLLSRSTFRGFDFAAMNAPIAEELGYELLIVDELPTGDQSTLPPAPGDEPARTWLYYTSGSTADPKGVWHIDPSVMASSNTWVHMMDPTTDDVYPVAFPMAHIGGISMVCCALRGGFHLFLVEAWDPQQSPLDMAAEGCTMLGSALPFFLAFLAAQEAHGDEPLFPRLRSVSSGGAPKPPGIHEEIRDRLGGAGVLGSWGLTEFPVATGAAPGDPDDMLAITEGRVGPGVDLKVVALDGHECGELEEGELRLRGPQTFLGYANPALATTGVDDEGFVCTGDLGVVHPGGYVQITGRVKDIIIRNAENISATEIEEHLFDHPVIHDVAVIGVPDPRTGERAVAVVQLAAGYDALTLQEVGAFCIDRGLAKWKIPEQLEIVDTIPRNGMGKIEKPALRKRYAHTTRPS